MLSSRLIVTKYIYPIIVIICFIFGVRWYLDLQKQILPYLEKTNDHFLWLWFTGIKSLFILFFIFLVISFIILLKPPTMKKYKTSLKTVLEYENRNEDVLEDQGHEMRKETDYRLTAKRFDCPTCNKSTEGIRGTFKTCEYCGNTFKLS